MGKLVYSMNVSLDGFVETPDHGLDWALVDEELHTWFNEQARSMDAFLYGRRLYEVMTAFPSLSRPIGLSLRETRTFGSGVTYLMYVAA